MASFKGSFFSKLSGKIGSITTYELNGTQVVRVNTIPHDPKTPKQLAHRMKFALVNKGLSPLSNAIKLGHRGDTNAYRALVGRAYHEAIMGEYPSFAIDYSMIKIAEGDLQPPAGIKLMLDAEYDSALFSWDGQNHDSLNMANDNDQINIVVFNDREMAVNHISEIANRSDGSVSIILPNGWKHGDIHFWAYFSSHTLEMNSASVYVVR